MTASPLPGMDGIISLFGVSPGVFWVLFGGLIVLTIILKGIALWHAARNYQRAWFVAILVINTFGILELVYLIGFRRDKDESRTQSLFNTPEGPVSSSSA